MSSVEHSISTGTYCRPHTNQPAPASIDVLFRIMEPDARPGVGRFCMSSMAIRIARPAYAALNEESGHIIECTVQDLTPSLPSVLALTRQDGAACGVCVFTTTIQNIEVLMRHGQGSSQTLCAAGEDEQVTNDHSTRLRQPGKSTPVAPHFWSWLDGRRLRKTCLGNTPARSNPCHPRPDPLFSPRFL